jgi:alpha-tubulin suppressor-like RCC1 family protein
MFSVAAILPAHAAPMVTNVYAGSTESFVIFSDGSLWAAGGNNQGQLGDGTYNTVYRFKEIFTNYSVFVATGLSHTMLIGSDGSLAVAGDNIGGDLGDGGSNPANKFEGVFVVPTGVIGASAGNFHSMFIKKNGSLMGMGANTVAQLGDGTLNNTNKPEQIVANGIVKVACSANATFYIRNDSSLWGTGSMDNFRFDEGLRPSPVMGKGASNVACGTQHALVITTNGALLAFGANADGQLGDGTTNQTIALEQIVPNGVATIACGGSHSHFLKSDGSLWSMGINDVGQIGDGTTNNCLTPKEIVSNSVVAVAAGQFHCMFLKSDGSVWATGYGGFGQLGDGFTNTALVPRQIFPRSAPVLATALSEASDLKFSASCPVGGAYYLMAGTNLALPTSEWKRVATNLVYDLSNNVFSATLTNAVPGGAVHQFYLLKAQ